MNASQIHLALNHVPLFFSIAGGLTLIYGFIRKNDQTKSLSLYFMILAALFVIPVYLTGESTEETVENLPAVSESLIERHEGIAQVGLIVIISTGIAALITLIIKKKESLLKPLLMFCLVASIASFGVMAQTAHLGGQIRHSEIRKGAVAEQVNSEKNKDNQDKERDDD
jgi:uncharacterized membrane protein